MEKNYIIIKLNSNRSRTQDIQVINLQLNLWVQEKSAIDHGHQAWTTELHFIAFIYKKMFLNFSITFRGNI